MPARRGRGENGQVVPLMALLVVLAAALAYAVGMVGVRATTAARAQTAADAAALAGAIEGPAGARDLAAANGARLEQFEDVVGGARVRVSVGGWNRTARAEVVAEIPGPTAAAAEGLQPAMRAALARAEELLGRPVPITSGFRSRADQERLWANRHTNPYPVARPGTSRHETGLAVDVPRSFVATLNRVASRAGLCRPLPVSDPIHFELCRWTPPS